MSNCACLIDASDFEPVKSIHKETRRARVACWCNECRRMIVPGELYIREVVISDGSFDTLKRCLDCESLQSLICGRIFNGLREAIEDEARFGGIDPSHPAIRDMTPAAREWVCDLIEAEWAMRAGGLGMARAAEKRRDPCPCVHCGHGATSHEVDDEELRGCLVPGCPCVQYEAAR